MKKLLLIGLIGAFATFLVAKKTNMCSYVSTFAAHVQDETKKQIPTRFEIERIRHEINNLDNDVSNMIRPIAEQKVAIERTRKDITRTQTNIDEQKKSLLAIVEDLQDNPKTLVIAGKTYTADRVRQQLQRDMEKAKHLEKQVKTQHQVLEAKENSLRATQEQLAKVVAKKREYEVRLAQLEAQHETIQITMIGSHIKIDSSRATQIETALATLEQKLTTDAEEAALRTGEFATIALSERQVRPAELQTIRDYLEGKEEAKTATNR
ncbi:MAG: hypothetical protein EXS16_19035 [Gemmataceae bacterium]|nr:hypothetical protein [Gemmataceae bacterium]